MIAAVLLSIVAVNIEILYYLKFCITCKSLLGFDGSLICCSSFDITHVIHSVMQVPQIGIIQRVLFYSLHVVILAEFQKPSAGFLLFWQDCCYFDRIPVVLAGFLFILAGSLLFWQGSRSLGRKNI